MLTTEVDALHSVERGRIGLLICPVCLAQNPDGTELCMACCSDLLQSSAEDSDTQRAPELAPSKAAQVAFEEEQPHGQAQRAVALERDSKGFQWLSAPEEERSLIEGAATSPTATAGMALTADLVDAAMAGWTVSIPTIKAPELAPFPSLPVVVSATPTPDSRGLAAISYALTSRSVVRDQREVVRKLGAIVAKLRRQESSCIEALGRGARTNDLSPSHVLDRAAAADIEELAALERREHADVKQQEEQRAERLYHAIHSAGQARLEKLREISAPLVERYNTLERRRALMRDRLEELTERERTLGDLASRPPTEEELGGEIHMEEERIIVSRRSVDEEISARMTAHHQCLADLAEAKETLPRIAELITKTSTPIERIKAEAAKIRETVEAARNQALEARDQARAAAVSGERRTDFAHRSAAELDVQIGQAVLDEGDHHPALERLVKRAREAGRQVKTVEALLEEQNDQITLYDAGIAKTGTSLLIVASVVAVAAAGIGLVVILGVLQG